MSIVPTGHNFILYLGYQYLVPTERTILLIVQISMLSYS